jgi:hypothetical protein
LVGVKEPWKPSSPALLRIQDLEANEGLFFDDYKYLLEVDTARDAVDVYEKWRATRASKPRTQSGFEP